MKRKYIAKRLSLVMTAAMIMAASGVPVSAASVESAQVEEQPPAEQAPASSNPSTPEESSKPASSESSSSGTASSGTSESDTKKSDTGSSSDNASAGSGSSQTQADTGASGTSSSASSAASSTTSSSDTDTSDTDTSDTNTSGTAASTGSSSGEAAPAQDTGATQNTSASASTSSDKSSQEKETEPEETKEVEEADKHTGTNEQLISEQNIQDVDVPEFNTDFRFYAADSKDTQELAAKEEVTVYEETNTDSKKVGKLRKCASATKLRDVKDGWIFIESGEVRGFAKSDWFYHGDEAEEKQKEYESEYISNKEKEAAAGTALDQKKVSAPVNALNLLNMREFFADKQELAAKEASEEARKYLDESKYGTALVSPSDNGAYAYTRTTAQTHVTDKVPAFANDSTSIYEEKSDSSTKAGTLDKDALAFVIESDGDWTYVESGDTRGFVKTSSLTTGDEAKNTYNSRKESDFATAKQLVKPSDNKATYYSIVSVKEGQKTSSVREAMVKMALSCAGNPYVWGGTSLTNGADCSGFVQAIYKSFGINLPRIACDQAKVGTQIKVSDAAPGDLIFFARNGYVYHVAMYAGDGKTIEAYSSKAGIGVHGLSGRPAVWACRILKD